LLAFSGILRKTKEAAVIDRRYFRRLEARGPKRRDACAPNIERSAYTS
jgi:hypothetical protein